MANKSHLLDPLNTMFKLALVNISEPDSRLSINNHVVTLQQPGKHMGLGMFRYINNDDRNDLYLLLRSVKTIIEWFITEDPCKIKCGEQKDIIDSKKKKKKISQVDNIKDEQSERAKDDSVITNKKDYKQKERSNSEKLDTVCNNNSTNRFYKSKSLLHLMTYASDGLERLQKFYLNKYIDDSVVLVIQFMINLLNDGRKGILDLDRLPINYRTTDHISLVHIQEILNIWTDMDIDHVLQFFHDSKKYINDETEGNRIILNGYMKTITDQLLVFDDKFKKIIETSYA